MTSFRLVLALVGINLVYACTSIFMKMASLHDVASLPFFLWIFGAIGVMALYALLWQQIISRMELSTAYMFKGVSLLFVLLFSAFLFGESISFNNIIGSVLIVLGIVLNAKA